MVTTLQRPAKKSTKEKPPASDKFQLVTDKLITLIEQGVKPWTKPWHSRPYQNLLTKHSYRGINPMLCSIDMWLYNYDQPYFLGFTQASNKGWAIKKGSKSTWIRWGGTHAKETQDGETGETKTEFYSAFKWMNVFNVACLDDTESDIKIDAYIEQNFNETPNTEPRIDGIENLLKSHNHTISFGSEQAFYQSSKDTIVMPNYEKFSSAKAYYSTYLHELTHWTGHETRLNRKLGNQFGSPKYAFEELIAEIGSAILCNEYQVDLQLENHASYLDHWLTALKGDKKYFFDAVAKATMAANFLLPKQPLIADNTES